MYNSNPNNLTDSNIKDINQEYKINNIDVTKKIIDLAKKYYPVSDVNSFTQYADYCNNILPKIKDIANDNWQEINCNKLFTDSIYSVKQELLQELDFRGYKGIDASVENSLFDYGIIGKTPENSNRSIKLIYYTDSAKNYFNIITVRKSIIARLLVNNNNWFSTTDFLNYIGFNSVQEYLKTPVINQLYDTIGYYGQLNILGENRNRIENKQELLETIKKQ